MWKVNRVSMDDIEKLFQWRNSPEVYRYLFNANPVERSEHEKWLLSVLSNNLVAFYKVNYQGNDIGTVRFDFDFNYVTAEVGIYLAPEFQGLGLGSQLLDHAEKQAMNEYENLKKIVAKVMHENIASEKMFVKTGYAKKFIQLEKEL